MPTSDLAGSSSFTIAEILAKLGTDPKTGLNPAQVQERLNKYGPNALAEEKSAFWFPCLLLGPYRMDDRGRCSDGVNRRRLGRSYDHYLAFVVQRLVRILGGT